MSNLQKIGIVAFILLSLAMLAIIALLLFMSQMHPFDCSDPVNECSYSILKIAGFAIAGCAIWLLSGWLALRDWSVDEPPE